MNAHVNRPASERGIALVTVLLLMAVLSGLATGFAMNGQTESAMAANEVYYAGARAAAEAGMNRAIERIVNDTATNLLAGPDQLATADPGDAVNDDNGDISFLFATAGPYTLDAAGDYTYTIEVLDDDDPQLYTTALTNAQKVSMGENVTDSPFIDDNDRLILRVTGFGPRNTVVRIMRELQSAPSVVLTTTTSLANPAILVNGDLDISGNISLLGDEGNVHANGNLTISGNASDVTGDATATGTYTANENWSPNGAFGGGRDAITTPDIQAANYKGHADFILKSDGSITNVDGSSCGGSCPDGWTFSGGTWSVAGNSVSAGTFYVEGNVSISGSPGKKGGEIAFSVISEGSISITGTPKFKPENDAKLQFVSNGDLVIAGNADLDDPTQVEGQIFVREQLSISGNPDFQGRILVQNAPSVFNQVTTNSISGNPTLTYNGTLDAIETENTVAGATTYINNVRGWMEQ